MPADEAEARAEVAAADDQKFEAVKYDAAFPPTILARLLLEPRE